MTIDPQTITPLNRFTEADIETIVTTHGVTDVTQGETFLVEPQEDYSSDRLPIAIPLANEGELADGAYTAIRGNLSMVGDRTPSFDAATLEVDAIECYAPSLDEHADITSTNKAYETVDDILSEFSDPIPRRYIIEGAIERGIDREAAEEILTRMETAGNIYVPEVGRVGSM